MKSALPGAIKIASYKIRQSGRGLVAALPATWVQDLGVLASDKIEIFRDTKDCLILRLVKRTTA